MAGRSVVRPAEADLHPAGFHGYELLDRPGIVGYLGTLLARHKVNIASMSLSRDTAGGHALTVLNLDSVPPAEVLDEIQNDPDISNVTVVRL